MLVFYEVPEIVQIIKIEICISKAVLLYGHFDAYSLAIHPMSSPILIVSRDHTMRLN